MENHLTTNWYQELVEECKVIITEAVFTSRWALVDGYWNLGKRLREDKNFNTKLLQGLAVKLNTSERTIWYALQTFDKFPELDKIPEGKNISWNKLITKYLPEPKKEKIVLPEGRFNVLLADPAWEYRNTGVDGSAEKEYPTMSIQELCNMKVKELTSENSVLFLWVTNPLLEECFEVIKNWGFQYKTNFVWHKKNKKTGIGFYVRGVHELLLICIKGQMLPEYTPLSTISEDAREHSKKPEVYDLIEKMYPNQKYLELFARDNKKRKNWSYWGNQANI